MRFRDRHFKLRKFSRFLATIAYSTWQLITWPGVAMAPGAFAAVLVWLTVLLLVDLIGLTAAIFAGVILWILIGLGVRIRRPRNKSTDPIGAGNVATNRAARIGAVQIFQEEDRLTFKEIAQRWEAESEFIRPSDDVLNWLVSDMWKGKFEDEAGNSQLQILDGFYVADEVPPTGRDVDANRRLLFGLLVRDCPQLVSDLFPYTYREALLQLAHAGWQTQRSKINWGQLAKAKANLFDEKSALGRMPLMDFRSRVLERLTITRDDFQDWLSQTQRPLPKAWSK